MQSAFIWIFVISFVIRIWFNFIFTGGNAAFACDAAEYLRHAQSISRVLNSLFVDHPDSAVTCLKVLTGQSNLSNIILVKQIFIPLQSMSIAGPVFPMFLLACYKVCGQDPTAQGWAIPVLVQCLLSSLASVLITSISATCWGKRTGLVAGIIASLYPGFIINSGRLYSESFACFLLCLVIWLIKNYLVNNKTHYLWGLLLGVTLFSLQTTRSVMFLLSLAIVFFCTVSIIFNTQKRKLAGTFLLSIVCSFFLCALPWLALQKLAFGKASLIVDRVGNYNLFVGNDVDSFGWLSIPYPDLSGIERQKYSDIFAQAIRRSPERFLKLWLDKPVRLFKLPWNDFRTNIGPISVNTQALFHQLLLILAALGLIVSFCNFDKHFREPKYLGRVFILFAFLLHIVYLAFITVPRYALTAMPELILFTASGITCLANVFKTKTIAPLAIRLSISILLLLIASQLELLTLFGSNNSQSIMLTQSFLYANIAIKFTIFFLFIVACWQLVTRTIPLANQYFLVPSIIFIVLAALPSYCLPLRAHGRWYGYTDNFKSSGVSAERNIALNQTSFESLLKNEAYLAINIAGGSNLPTDWNITINNIRIEGPFIPAISLAQDLTLVHLDKNNNFTIEQESVLNSLCSVSSMSPLDLQQWYLIPISVDKWQTILGNVDRIKDLNAKNLSIKLEKCADSETQLFGAHRFNNSFSIIPSIFRFSWEKAFYGVENQNGLTDPTYDQKITIINPLENKNNNKNNNLYIKLLIPQAAQMSSDRRHIKYVSSSALKLADRQFSQANFSERNYTLSFKPKNPDQSSKDLYWLVRLFGTINNNNDNKLVVRPNIQFAAVPAKLGNHAVSSFASPWLPNSVKADLGSKANPLKFDICFPMLVGAFSQPIKNIELNLLKENIDKTTISNEANPIVPIKKANIQCYLEIYKMTRLLSGVRYEIL